MSALYACLSEGYDLRLILLAAAACLLGSLLSLGLLRRVPRAGSRGRLGWLALTGMVCGADIWCAHFMAMLAHDPRHSLSFLPLLLLGTLATGMLGCTAAFAVATAPFRGATLAGGGLLGLCIGAVHYLGVAAQSPVGSDGYHLSLILLSLAVAVALGAVALWTGLRPRSPQGWLEGGAYLTLAILTLHFTGMGALCGPLPPAAETGLTSHGMLALLIGLAALMVLAAAATAAAIDHQRQEEGELRLRRLVDSAIEGLAVTLDGRIIEANASFQAMVGEPRARLIGRELIGAFLPPMDLPATVALTGHAQQAHELGLRRADGSTLEVEVVVRDNVPRPGERTFALRDLRERREQERRIHHLALHDPLTGLANRTRFTQQASVALMQAAGAGRKLAMMQLGLNGLKDINDLHGHLCGDAVLRGYAQRLGAAIPGEAILGRLGGDEFGLLLPFGPTHEVDDIIRRIEALNDAVEKIGEAEIVTSATLGIALFPADGGDLHALLAHADAAMRRAKAMPGRPACFYRAEMDAALRRRRRMTAALRRALETDQLSIVFQPQVDVSTGQQVGHEALLRWHHPEMGFVSPEIFIPLAEESGLILSLGEWVMRQACRQAAAEPRLGRIGVNLSPLQFAQADLPRLIAAVLVETGLPPSRLELEITESTLMQDEHRTLDMLRQIKALGVAITMDDFGTGYSSLGTLRAFPFDKIKLDRRFLQEIGSSEQALAILRAVLGIGRALNIPVLAEGVETAQQLERLRAEDCDEAQGYLFGRPLPLGALSFPEARLLA